MRCDRSASQCEYTNQFMKKLPSISPQPCSHRYLFAAKNRFLPLESSSVFSVFLLSLSLLGQANKSGRASLAQIQFLLKSPTRLHQILTHLQQIA